MAGSQDGPAFEKFEECVQRRSSVQADVRLAALLDGVIKEALANPEAIERAMKYLTQWAQRVTQGDTASAAARKSGVLGALAAVAQGCNRWESVLAIVRHTCLGKMWTSNRVAGGGSVVSADPPETHDAMAHFATPPAELAVAFAQGDRDAATQILVHAVHTCPGGVRYAQHVLEALASLDTGAESPHTARAQLAQLAREFTRLVGVGNAVQIALDATQDQRRIRSERHVACYGHPAEPLGEAAARLVARMRGIHCPQDARQALVFWIQSCVAMSPLETRKAAFEAVAALGYPRYPYPGKFTDTGLWHPYHWHNALDVAHKTHGDVFKGSALITNELILAALPFMSQGGKTDPFADTVLYGRTMSEIDGLDVMGAFRDGDRMLRMAERWLRAAGFEDQAVGRAMHDVRASVEIAMSDVGNAIVWHIDAATVAAHVRSFVGPDPGRVVQDYVGTVHWRQVTQRA